jgi:hypothetical protein
MSIAPYARFSYLKKKEAVIELLPVRQENVCGILAAFSCRWRSRFEELGQRLSKSGCGASSRRLPVMGRIWGQ